MMKNNGKIVVIIMPKQVKIVPKRQRFAQKENRMKIFSDTKLKLRMQNFKKF